jgi:hypothetical protein
MGIVSAQVTIVGTRPLLWNHFGRDNIPLAAKERTGKAGNDPSEWPRTVLTTGKGQLYLEPSAVFGCLRAGAKFTPRKRGTLQPLGAATVQVSGDWLLVDRWLPAKREEPSGAPKEDVHVTKPIILPS